MKMVKTTIVDMGVRPYLIKALLGAMSRRDEIFNPSRYEMQWVYIHPSPQYRCIVLSQAGRQPHSQTGVVNHAYEEWTEVVSIDRFVDGIWSIKSETEGWHRRLTWHRLDRCRTTTVHRFGYWVRLQRNWSNRFTNNQFIFHPLFSQIDHDDIIKLKHFPRYWPFVRGIHWWIPLTKASCVELWCFLWSAPKQTAEQTIETLVIWDAIALIIIGRQCNAVSPVK